MKNGDIDEMASQYPQSEKETGNKGGSSHFSRKVIGHKDAKYCLVFMCWYPCGSVLVYSEFTDKRDSVNSAQLSQSTVGVVYPIVSP